MTSGCGKAKTIESLEFILTSNGLIHYIAKDYTESFIGQKSSNRVSQNPSNSDDEDTNSEVSDAPSAKSFADNSCLTIITPIQLKYHSDETPPSPVCSVSFSADECPQYAALTKVNGMATIQVYLKKGYPLVLRCPLGTHGHAIFTYVDVAPDEREKATKNKASLKKRPPTKLPKRRDS